MVSLWGAMVIWLFGLGRAAGVCEFLSDGSRRAVRWLVRRLKNGAGRLPPTAPQKDRGRLLLKTVTPRIVDIRIYLAYTLSPIFYLFTMMDN